MKNNSWFRIFKDGSLSTRDLLVMIFGVILVRLLLTLLPSYQVDMGGYRAWSHYLANYGYDEFYQTFHVVYGPVFPYLLHLSGFLAKAFSFGVGAHEYLIKLWAVLSDLVGAVLIYNLGKRRGQERLAVFLAIAYTLNPAVFFNSSIWGQFDSLSATMLMGTFYLLSLRRKPSAVVLFIVAILTKPQSIIVLPMITYLFFAFDFKWRDLFLSAVAGVAIYLVIILPFSAGRPVYWLFGHYLKSGGDYPYATANAFNLWTLLGGQAVKDTELFVGLTFAVWSLILLVIVCVMVLFMLRRKPNQVFSWFFAAYFLAFGTFFFGSRMHERYLFPAFIFLTTLILWENEFLLPLGVLSICHLANQWYIYELAGEGVYWVNNFHPPAVIISFVTLGVMIHAQHYFFRHIKLPALSVLRSKRGV